MLKGFAERIELQINNGLQEQQRMNQQVLFRMEALEGQLQDTQKAVAAIAETRPAAEEPPIEATRVVVRDGSHGISTPRDRGDSVSAAL